MREFVRPFQVKQKPYRFVQRRYPRWAAELDSLIAWKACAMSVEQIARVGEPAPSAIILRRKRLGTGGVGNR